MMIRPLLLLLGMAMPLAAAPNVLFICVDDLRPELGCYGAPYINSPAMDALAASGRAFSRHYVQAPTCGASRCALLTGRYPRTPARRNNEAIFDYASHHDKEPPSLPEMFRSNGYRTVSLGKVTHHPGGLGGPTWDDSSQPELPNAWDHHEMPGQPWKNPLVAMHGYANGKGRKPGVTPPLEHEDGDDKTYTDGWIAEAAVNQLEELAKAGKPFFLAVGFMKPHLPFACPKSYRDAYQTVTFPAILHPEKPAGLSTWHPSGEFFQYNQAGRDPRQDAAYAGEVRRSYAACVSYTDTQIAKVMAKLDQLGLTDSTIVVLWSDHGYHLGEHNIWGKHTLFEESLRSPLVIRTPKMTSPGVASNAVIETVDLYPTLGELCHLPLPAQLDGHSLTPILTDPQAAGRSAISFGPTTETIRTATHRLIRHAGKADAATCELYDEAGHPGETENIAKNQPDLIRELSAQIDRHF